MPFTLQCFKCRKQHTITQELLGRTVKCKCDAVMEIPHHAPRGDGSVSILTNSLGIKLIKINPGTFMMGARKGESDSTAERPQIKVKLATPYYIGAYPVTQREFQSITGKNPSRRKDPHCPVEIEHWKQAMFFCIGSA